MANEHRIGFDALYSRYLAPVNSELRGDGDAAFEPLEKQNAVWARSDGTWGAMARGEVASAFFPSRESAEGWVALQIEASKLAPIKALGAMLIGSSS